MSDSIDGFSDRFSHFGRNGASGRGECGHREGGARSGGVVDVVREIDGERRRHLVGEREGENGVDGVFEVVEIGNVALFFAAEILQIAEHVDRRENGSAGLEREKGKSTFV